MDTGLPLKTIAVDSSSSSRKHISVLSWRCVSVRCFLKPTDGFIIFRNSSETIALVLLHSSIRLLHYCLPSYLTPSQQAVLLTFRTLLLDLPSCCALSLNHFNISGSVLKQRLAMTYPSGLTSTTIFRTLYEGEPCSIVSRIGWGLS